MPITYTAHDRAVRDSIAFIISDDDKFVDNAATRAELGEYLGRRWPFQFPPRVLSDSKSAEWLETSLVSYEPKALWKGANARAISVEALYVVTGEKEFSGIEIAKLANASKAYFYRSTAKIFDDGAGGQAAFGPIVIIESLYGAVRTTSTWRMTDVNVEYARTFVSDTTLSISRQPSITSALHDSLHNIPGPINSVWPTWTKITFNLKSMTRITDEDGKELLALSALSKSPTAKWF